MCVGNEKNLVDGGVKRVLKYLEDEDITSDTKEKLEQVWSESDQEATDAIVALIHQGVDVKAPDGGATVAIHYAAANGHVEVLSLLLEQGGDVAQDNDGRTALHYAAEDGTVEVLSLLLERGADVSVQDNDGWTALHLAALHGDVEKLSLLLERGADVDAQTKDGWTALHYAARHGYVGGLSLLLEGGADVDAQDKDGWTALHLAALHGHTEVLSLLLKGGADVAAQDKDGWTALHYAADNGHTEVLSLLLEEGADVSVQDKDGLTALHYAATSGRIKAVSLLLDRNADAHAITKEGHNPLCHMILKKRDDPDDGYLDVVRLLSSLEPKLSLSPLIESSTLEMHQLGMLTCAQYWQGRQKDKLPLLKVPSEVVAGGEDAVKTYLTEVEKTATGIYRRKVCVVGPSTWGKTSLIKSITSKEVSLEKMDERTIGIDLFSMEFEEASDDNEGMKRHYVTFWDFAGQDIYQLAHALFFSERTLYLLCLDMEKYTEHLGAGADSDSMRIFLEKNVIHWIHIILTRQPKARFKLIGTKCDTVSDDALHSAQRNVKLHLGRLLQDADPLVKVEYTTESRKEFDQNLLVTSATSPESLLRARESIKTTIRDQSELSFLMPESYSAVLQYIIDIRRSVAKATPKERVQKLVVKQFDICDGLLNNVECLDNSLQLCTEILQTLHRLGDILWWKQEGDFQEWIILDPAIMLDLVRDVVSHTHEFQKGDQYAKLCRDGRLEHALLKSFEWWEALDTEVMTMFKLLLKKCCLAYPVNNVEIEKADLIVPTYWKTKEKANAKRTLEKRSSVLDQHYIDGADSAKWRYSLPVGISEAIYLNFAVQCYDREDVTRNVGPTFMESYIDGELACGIYFASGPRCDTITIEVVASTNDIAWTEMSYWVIAMEQVLLDYPGLDQPNHKRIGRYVVSRDNTEHSVNDFLRNERNLDEGRLRETYHWLPPDFEWFLQCAWKTPGKLAELRRAHQLIVLKRLIVNQDKRRLPAVWTLLYEENSSMIELRIHSDLSGKCFHDPLRIRAPGSFQTFVAEHREFFQAGISILSLASVAIPFAVASTAVGMALSAVGGAVSGTSNSIKSILEKTGLVPGKTRKFDKEEHKTFLREVLNYHDPPLDEFKIGPVSELCCAATENGSYVWVHHSEVAALTSRFKECTCISMCFTNVIGLKPTKKENVYYEWKLVRSDKVIEENTIQIEANTSTGVWRASQSVPLEVNSVEDLRQCKLEMTVKRKRQATCWPRKEKELGNGGQAFGDFKISGFSGSNTIEVPISRRTRGICRVECQITVVSTRKGL
ncbi:hypothetical protein DVH05_001383 [Phytophthora capsici]|nr:hypothetical protein DVH05_001383 [Phytophthora capsici]